MSRKRVPPEAQIIALFSGLTEENQRMVMFGLNAMMAQAAPKIVKPPKSIAPAVQSAGKKSSRKNAARTSGQTIADDKASVSGASKPIMCGVCGNAPEHVDHLKSSPQYHYFVGKKQPTLTEVMKPGSSAA